MGKAKEVRRKIAEKLKKFDNRYRKKIAETAKVSVQTVKNWINGSSPNADVENAIKAMLILAKRKEKEEREKEAVLTEIVDL